MRKRVLTGIAGSLMLFFIGFSVFFLLLSFPGYAKEATFSEYWFQDAEGWHVSDGKGGIIRNAWLCDDAVPANGKDIWYLIDADGKMISAGLLQDRTGNFYSLETEHNGYYGMLRYQSGTYPAGQDTVTLSLEGSHNGSFAAIRNESAIEKLKAVYGLTQLSIDNSNIVYTSQLGKTALVTEQKAPSAELLTAADFVASGKNVAEADLLSSLRRQYGKDAAFVFYFDSSADADRKSVVKTARGITLASRKEDVLQQYGEGTVIAPEKYSTEKGTGIAYGYDPYGVRKYMTACRRYDAEDGSASLYFGWKENGEVSYIIYYLY